MSGIIDLLGGAKRGKTRARGFASWRPQKKTLVLLDQVESVLDEYTAYLPLTVRQIFYRLVGAHGFEKTEAAYNRLGEHLNRARRAGLLDMDAIRDDGGSRHGGPGWSGPEVFLDWLREQAASFRGDYTAGQPGRLMVLCEASGMAPQLASVTDPYDIAVISSGGFESVTEQHRIAQEIAAMHRPCEVLHVGDHDPSGAHLVLALYENVDAFIDVLGGDVRFTRLAVTPEQIAAYSLPTAPPKETDNRAFTGDTCQVEALPPDVLADILRQAIIERIDHAAYDAARAQEATDRAALIERLRLI